MKPVDPDRGVYGISVAAELTGLAVQNLRVYETRGLLEPDRTPGGTRRYSANDLDRLRRIGDLLDAGLNLAGVGMVLELERRNHALTRQNSRLRAETEELRWFLSAAKRPRASRPGARGAEPPSQRRR